MSARSSGRRVIPLPGSSGYAVVVDGAVAFIGGGDVIAQSVLDQVVRRAPDGNAVLDRLAGLLSSSPSLRYPGIAVVCDIAGGHELLVAGATEVAGSGPHGAGRWRATGEHPERHAIRAMHALTLGAVRARSLDGLDDLHRGTVACDGVAVIWSHDLADADAGDDPGDTDPGEGSRPARVVDGVICPAGHLDAPGARTCRTCGTAIDAAGGARRARGLRPPLATLVFDTGETFEIADDAVVGRAVDDDPRVALGLAAPVVPGGDTAALSRRHAWLVVRGWSLEVIDLGARNGTFVRRAGAPGWERIEPGRVAPLAPGDSVAFGRRVAHLESPRRFRTAGGAPTSNESPTTEGSDHADQR